MTADLPRTDVPAFEEFVHDVHQRRAVVIRFDCPQCGKRLEVVEEKAGKAVACPRCEERLLAPAASAEREETEQPTQAAPEPSGRADRPRGLWLWSGMSRRVRFAAAGLAVVGALSLLLAALAPDRGGAVTPWAMILFPCCSVLLLVILHGQATGCPSCGRWWARTKVETEFLDREVFDKEGVLVGRSLYRTTYECDSCRHRWSVTQADEYPEPCRPRERRRHRA
jgi:ssDNA-binding Zn-finger/Zn-ribbon topoisomerase 1